MNVTNRITLRQVACIAAAVAIIALAGCKAGEGGDAGTPAGSTDTNAPAGTNAASGTNADAKTSGVETNVLSLTPAVNRGAWSAATTEVNYESTAPGQS